MVVVIYSKNGILHAMPRTTHEVTTQDQLFDHISRFRNVFLAYETIDALPKTSIEEDVVVRRRSPQLELTPIIQRLWRNFLVREQRLRTMETIIAPYVGKIVTITALDPENSPIHKRFYDGPTRSDVSGALLPDLSQSYGAVMLSVATPHRRLLRADTQDLYHASLVDPKTGYQTASILFPNAAELLAEINIAASSRF